MSKNCHLTSYHYTLPNGIKKNYNCETLKNNFTYFQLTNIVFGDTDETIRFGTSWFYKREWGGLIYILPIPLFGIKHGVSLWEMDIQVINTSSDVLVFDPCKIYFSDESGTLLRRQQCDDEAVSIQPGKTMTVNSVFSDTDIGDMDKAIFPVHNKNTKNIRETTIEFNKHWELCLGTIN